MDDGKGIQNSSELATLLEADSVKTNPFGSNINADRLFRRAEALVSALHLVTAHIASDEPVRNEVRRWALQLLSDTLSLRDTLRTSSREVGDVQKDIRELIALSRVLVAGNFVSVQNGSELASALDEMGSFLISVRRSALSDSVRISRENFSYQSDVSLRKGQLVKDKVIQKDSSKGHAKRHPVGDTSDAREELILKILNPGTEIGIKDISIHVPEMSEKMIQRVLLSLVAKGRIKKTGSKRWSKYSLIF